VRTRERNGPLVPIRDRLLDTEVEDAGTAGLRIVSWIGLLLRGLKYKCRVEAGSLTFCMAVLHQRSRVVRGQYAIVGNDSFLNA
jgi:hypothetical protein